MLILCFDFRLLLEVIISMKAALVIVLMSINAAVIVEAKPNSFIEGTLFLKTK